MHKLKKIDFCRHLSFAVVGGFFAAYAILCRSGVMGNAQTVNLLELLIDALFGRGLNVLLHLGALALYVLGTMLTVLLPHWFRLDIRRTAPVVDALAAVVLGFLPAEMPVTLALYPIFFAMSVQWGAFNGAQGFNSSTIFSTNNTKQTSLALAHYLCEKDPMYLAKCWFYAATLLCFHLGATLSFFAVKLWGLRASWCVIPLAAWAYSMVCCEAKSEQRTPAELREREVTGETIEELHEAEDVLLEEKKK